MELQQSEGAGFVEDYGAPAVLAGGALLRPSEAAPTPPSGSTSTSRQVGPLDSRQARRAAIVLAAALALGLATRALFWRTALGVNVPIFLVVCIAACLASVRPPRVTGLVRGVILAALALGLAFVKLRGDWTLAIALPTSLALLLVLPVALRDDVALEAAARLPWNALSALGPGPAAAAARDAARLPSVAFGGKHETLKHGLVGLAVGLPATVVFAALLSADVDFGRFLLRAGSHVSDAVSFLAGTLMVSIAALLAHVAHQRRPVPDDGHAAPSAYRHGQGPALFDGAAVAARPGRVAVSTWLMVLGQVATVFGLFVAVNVRGLFGGHALVRAPGSLTYARYLHAGFGQLLLASALSVWLVVLGHRLLSPRTVATGRGARAPVPGGRVLASMECVLLGLTAVTVASCAQRLAIYEDAYGATRLRLGVAFILLGVALALMLTAVKAVRRAWNGYGGALAALVVLLAVAASWFNADAYVARVNLDRAARGMPLDVEYLASLSSDARSVLMHATLQARPGLAARLREAYCDGGSPRGWRAFRGLGSCPPP